MSQFKNKVIRGEQTSADDWNKYLIEAHQAAPSMTSQAFLDHKTNDGLTSYEVLMNAVPQKMPKDSIVLDLACGDGHLIQFLLPKISEAGKIIGVDMSEAELSVAQKRYGHLKQVQFHHANAQSIPLAAQSADLAVCHMAFMLMTPVDDIISEINRVLKPGGQFIAVIANPRGEVGPYKDLRQMMFKFFDQAYPHLRQTKLGDPRVQSEGGIRDLFSSWIQQNSDIEILDYSICLSGDAQGIWDFHKNMYFVSFLSDREKQELEQQVKDFINSIADSRGKTNLSYPMRRFSVKKT